MKLSKHPQPLSPHLGIYRFTLLMAMSIAHRLTGIGLYLLFLIFVAGLVSFASGSQSWHSFVWALDNPVGMLVGFVGLWGLFHHMYGGIRHLIWDESHLIDVSSARRSALVTLILGFVTAVGVAIVFVDGSVAEKMSGMM